MRINKMKIKIKHLKMSLYSFFLWKNAENIFENSIQICNIALAKKDNLFSGPIAQLVRVEDS